MMVPIPSISVRSSDSIAFLEGQYFGRCVGVSVQQPSIIFKNDHSCQICGKVSLSALQIPHPFPLSGWDDKASERGTWLGMDRRGRVSVLLSITEPPNVTRKDAPSRGALVRDFLGGESTAREFLAELGPKAHHFNGFQFLVLDRQADSRRMGDHHNFGISGCPTVVLSSVH